MERPSVRSKGIIKVNDMLQIRSRTRQPSRPSARFLGGLAAALAAYLAASPVASGEAPVPPARPGSPGSEGGKVSISTALDRGMNWLVTKQNADGGYPPDVFSIAA